MADQVSYHEIHVAEELTLDNTTAEGFTTTEINGAPLRFARITAETNAVRYRMDGVAPTATVGHLVAAGATVDIYGEANIRRFRVISTNAGGSTVFCSLGMS